jgi:hypothetical protein
MTKVGLLPKECFGRKKERSKNMKVFSSKAAAGFLSNTLFTYQSTSAQCYFFVSLEINV